MKKKKKQIKKTKTLVNFILDRSGSMSSVNDTTISGFNEYLNTLKKDGNDYNFSLTLFDTEVENRHVNVPIKDVPELSKDTYTPNGMTALYDAACKTVNEVKKGLKKDVKVLTVIMTDGEENSSKEYTQEQFKAMVKELEKTKMWSFVYLGANQDAWANAQKYGFSAQNVSAYNSTTRGVKTLFAMAASNTSAMANAIHFGSGGGGGANGTGAFFSTADQKKLKETK